MQEVINVNVIKERREEKGISIEKMSEYLGLKSYQGYYYKESGMRSWSAEDIKIVASVLELTYEEIFL